jgi:ActR/RegA family two-component response regulator
MRHIARMSDQLPGEAVGGWMVSKLLGPYQSLRERVTEPRHVLLVALGSERAARLTEAIEARGHRVHLAHDTREALEQLLVSTPDLVVLAAGHRGAGPVVDAVTGSYARGVRAQIVTDDGSASAANLMRLLDGA